MRVKFDRTDSEGEEQFMQKIKELKVLWFQKFLVVKAFKRYPYKDASFTNKTIGSMRRQERERREVFEAVRYPD